MNLPKDIPFSDDEYHRVVGIVRRKTGVDFDGYREGVARRRIAKRVRETGCPTAAGYIDLLVTSRAEVEELVRAVTIQVSQFFRNPEVFDLLAHKFIPAILARKGPGERVRIWSAGCADGEEAHSIAILLLNFHGAKMAELDVKIVGTDVSPAAIAKAEAGAYDESRLALVDENLRRRYFRKKGKRFELRSAPRGLVEFRVENLFSGQGVPGADLALLRNLLIYFDRERQEELLEQVADRIARRGILVLGKSETLPQSMRSKFVAAAARERIYQRV